MSAEALCSRAYFALIGWRATWPQKAERPICERMAEPQFTLLSIQAIRPRLVV